MEGKANAPLLASVIFIAAAAALLLGQLTVNFAGIFADSGLYANGVFSIGAPSVFAGAIIIAAVCGCAFAAARFTPKKTLFVVLAVLALVLRIIFVFLWRIEPESDFLITYDLSRMLAQTRFDGWSAALKTAGSIYSAQWSAHMPFVVYQAFIMKIFGAYAAPVRIVNAVFSALTCVFAAGVSREISGRNAAFFTLFIMALNPLALFFIPVLTNQHAAVCFFIAAVWVFYARPLKNKYARAALCGALTALSHLLRPEMYVVIIAAAVWVLFGDGKKEKIKKAARFAVFTAVFFAVLLSADFALSRGGITERSVLEGNLRYKLAVGLNYETTGTWSEADAELIFDEQKCAEAIAERLENPAKTAALIVRKTAYQFGSYVYTWSMKDDFVSNEIYRRLSSAVMAVVGVLAAAALVMCVKNKEKAARLLPLAVVLAGYIAAFALIEVQPRYNYLIVPLLVIFAADGAGMLRR